MDRLSKIATKGKKRNAGDVEGLETRASSREITLKSDSVGRGICNVCNVTRGVICAVAICPNLVRAKESGHILASDAARAIKRERGRRALRRR